jgi:DNA-binding response OmpR family regulator
MTEEHSILLVDHDSESVDLYTDILAAAGYKVYVANTGMEALITLEHVRLSLVILNLDLRGMSGLAVCRGILQNSVTCHVPILALGSRPDEHRKTSVLAMGVQCVVDRPARPSELLQVVNEILLPVNLCER